MEIPMLRTLALSLLAAVGIQLAAADRAHADQKPAKDGHVAVNGLSYYYQIRGDGEPLLLLHGGLGQIEMFGDVLPMLAEKRKVIAVDLHGHGRTALGSRNVDVIDMGNDMPGILKALGHDKVDVMGYSLGGMVALRFAIQHPNMVRRLAVVSAGFSRDGFYPELLPMQAEVGAAMADSMKETPMYKSYMAVAPKPQDFPKLLDQMGSLMRKPFNWSAEVKNLKMPVMLVYGDSDMFQPSHIVEFYQLLGGGLRDAGWGREHMSQNRLAIIPDVTHYEMFFSPKLPTTVQPFLNGEGGAKTWADQVKGSSSR
jgi:pimeloyl-ACP methyl ester carboxylesterase